MEAETGARYRKSLQVAPEVYEALVTLAEAGKVSVNTEIVRALDHWLSLTKRQREQVLLTLPVRSGQQYHEKRKG